jgi:hypothetical protein
MFASGKVERTEEEIAIRLDQLIEELNRAPTGRTYVRLFVLQYLLPPSEAELRWKDADNHVRYAAVLESQWLYGYRDKPWEDCE